MYKRTGITMQLTQQKGYMLKEVITMLDKYVSEQLDNQHEPVKIICHGGTDHLFMILVLAIERSFGDDYLKELDHIIRANFVDSAVLLKHAGYVKTALYCTCKKLNIPLSAPQNAVGNACAIKRVCALENKIIAEARGRVTIQDLMHIAWGRLPLSIANVAMLAKHNTLEELLVELKPYCRETSALKISIVSRIANFYKKREDTRQSYCWLPEERSLWIQQPSLELAILMDSPYGA